jgi:hypothetical protein
MTKRIVLLLSISVLLFACNKAAEKSSTATETAAPTSTTAPAQAVATSAPATAPPAAAAATPAAGAISSQETNWKGVTADLTEFRRKGNTLTAKVRLTNRGSDSITPDVVFKEAYLIDTGGGKKYEVLKDEKGDYIASLQSGWNDRWHESLHPGDAKIIWMKFPAPPAEVKAITLQVPGIPPFEDINIQE